MTFGHGRHFSSSPMCCVLREWSLLWQHDLARTAIEAENDRKMKTVWLESLKFHLSYFLSAVKRASWHSSGFVKLKRYFWNVNKTRLSNDCTSTEWWYVTKKNMFSLYAWRHSEILMMDVLNFDRFASIGTTALTVITLSPLLLVFFFWVNHLWEVSIILSLIYDIHFESKLWFFWNLL